MAFSHTYGPWAIVTGAGNGLGAEFSRQLAARGVNVVAIDIDGEGLHTLATELQEQFFVLIKTLVLDVTDAGFMAQLEQAVADLDIGLVINNAGVSHVGLFNEHPLANHLSTVDINVRAPLMIAHFFVPQLVARGRGGIMFVSSMSALQGTSYVANYAGTKAWNLIFAESLWAELRGTGVDVLGYLVGSTRTPGFERSAPDLKKAKGVQVMSVSDTVAGALNGLHKGPVQVAGRSNSLVAMLLVRLLPRKWAIRLVSNTTSAMYQRDT